MAGASRPRGVGARTARSIHTIAVRRANGERPSPPPPRVPVAGTVTDTSRSFHTSVTGSTGCSTLIFWDENLPDPHMRTVEGANGGTPGVHWPRAGHTAYHMQGGVREEGREGQRRAGAGARRPTAIKTRVRWANERVCVAPPCPRPPPCGACAYIFAWKSSEVALSTSGVPVGSTDMATPARMQFCSAPTVGGR